LSDDIDDIRGSILEDGGAPLGPIDDDRDDVSDNCCEGGISSDVFRRPHFDFSKFLDLDRSHRSLSDRRALDEAYAERDDFKEMFSLRVTVPTSDDSLRNGRMGSLCSRWVRAAKRCISDTGFFPAAEETNYQRLLFSEDDYGVCWPGISLI
jgi:hypothetical protein